MFQTEQVYHLLENFRREGHLRSEIICSDPLEVMNLGYYPNGQLQFRYTINKGKLHGIGRRWYENDQLEREDPFHKGILHGRQRTWYSDGKIKSEMHYTNDCYDGRRREWYPDGHMKLECFYKMNLLEGDLVEWYPNGVLKERGSYFEGLRHGVWKEYDINGRLLLSEVYIRGVRLGGRIQRLLDSGRLSARYIKRIRNTAVRRICLEEFGYERFLLEVEHKTIDANEGCDLVRIDWHPQEEPLYLVRVKCPSTGAFYTLRVSPEAKTVREAVAWTFGLSEHEYQPQEES